jgi:hypothetical protein
MPRQTRIDAPGALQHVLIRGIERRKIFRDDADRENFLDRLGGILAETSTACYGWALREFGMSATAVAKRLKISQPAVSISLRRGEKISRDRAITLTDT